jgi:hypothetical protein
MEIPPVSFVVKDVRAGVVYDVRAYRTLTREEALDHIRAYLREIPIRQRPKRGQKITICLTLGGAPGV